jgi:hypothetical protein
MPDQEFKGLNPKSKAGESIFFYSMDTGSACANASG